MTLENKMLRKVTQNQCILNHFCWHVSGCLKIKPDR